MKKKLAIIISLLAITGFVLAEMSYAENVNIQADKQNYDGARNITTFEGNVNVNIDNINVKSPKASIQMGADGKPQEAVFHTGAVATKTDPDSKSEVRAKIIRLSLLENKIKAEGNVKSRISENTKPVATIKGDYQEFDITNNVINANGNVTIEYNNLKTSSSQADIAVDSGKLKLVNLTGNVKLVKENSVLTASNLTYNPESNEMVATGNAYTETILDGKEKVAIWANVQQFNQKTNTMITSGNVIINYQNYKANGPKAIFLPDSKTNKPNKIVFIGRAKIKEDTRNIEADKIEITVTPKNFKAEGNVKSQFTQLKGLTPGSVGTKDKNKNKKQEPVKTEQNKGLVNNAPKEAEHTEEIKETQKSKNPEKQEVKSE